MKLYKINESRLWHVIWFSLIAITCACVAVFSLYFCLPFIVVVGEQVGAAITATLLTVIVAVGGGIIVWKFPRMPVGGE